jgi:hypothetical protein
MPTFESFAPVVKRRGGAGRLAAILLCAMLIVVVLLALQSAYQVKVEGPVPRKLVAASMPA